MLRHAVDLQLQCFVGERVGYFGCSSFSSSYGTFHVSLKDFTCLGACPVHKVERFSKCMSKGSQYTRWTKTNVTSVRITLKTPVLFDELLALECLGVLEHASVLSTHCLLSLGYSALCPLVGVLALNEAHQRSVFGGTVIVGHRQRSRIANQLARVARAPKGTRIHGDGLDDRSERHAAQQHVTCVRKRW